MNETNTGDERYCRATPAITLAMPELPKELRLCWPHYQAWERKTFPLSYEEGMP